MRIYFAPELRARLRPAPTQTDLHSQQSRCSCMRAQQSTQRHFFHCRLTQAGDILDDRPERRLLVAFLRRCFCCFSFNGLYYFGDLAPHTQMCAFTSARPSVVTPAARVSAGYPPPEKGSRAGSENDPTTCWHCENGSQRSHLLPPGGAWPPQLPFSRRGTRRFTKRATKLSLTSGTGTFKICPHVLSKTCS